MPLYEIIIALLILMTIAVIALYAYLGIKALRKWLARRKDPNRRPKSYPQPCTPMRPSVTYDFDGGD